MLESHPGMLQHPNRTRSLQGPVSSSRHLSLLSACPAGRRPATQQLHSLPAAAGSHCMQTRHSAAPVPGTCSMPAKGSLGTAHQDPTHVHGTMPLLAHSRSIKDLKQMSRYQTRFQPAQCGGLSKSPSVHPLHDTSPAGCPGAA